jgi:hypothetical protein
MALAGGISRIKCGPLSLHTTTAIHFASLMTGTSFQILKKEGEDCCIVQCTGIGYVPQHAKALPSTREEAVDKTEPSENTERIKEKDGTTDAEENEERS